MSEVLDEKVVSMRFDNKDFEKNASESLSTIQKLKQALNFKDTSKNLDAISKASKKVDFSALSNSINTIASKFSVMEYAAFSAIQNITNKFVNAASQWVKSVTIEPVAQGFGVYEQRMSSVQTILNNSGKSLREVNKILDELNTYSDQTIFSLNDMTTALGKFTAQGIDAAQAVTIIKGAANEAASMGAGSAEFSRFIYNLTQAYGMGKMTTIDWKSLENAGVAGARFKEELIKSAKAMGKLDEAGRILQGSHKGMVVTAANLREYLQDGIIDAKVMTDTFTRYADAETDVGAAADRAAKEVKTFHQLMDVLSESVASTWSQSFSYIIGNFYEAKQLWTNVSEIFDQTVGKMNKRRNELLKGWYEGFIDPASIATENVKELSSYMNSGAFIDGKKISGRTLLLDGFANILQAILQVIKPIKEAFREFFPASTAKNLWEATKNFRDFTAHLKLSEGAIREIRDAFRGVFAIFKTFKLVLKDIIGAIFPATKGVDSLAVIILKLSGAIGRLITNSLSKLRNNKSYQEFLSNVTKFSAMAIKVISALVQWIAYLAKTAKDSGVLQEVFSDIASVVTKVFSIIVNGVPVAIRLFKLLGAGVGGIFVALGKASETFEGFFSKIFNKKDANEAKKNIDEVTKKTTERRRKQNEGTWTKEDQKAFEAEVENSKNLAETEKKNKSIFESIFSAVSTIVGNIISIVSKAWPFISGAVSVIVSFASGIINVLGNVSQVAVSIAQGIGKAISNIDTITVLLVGVFTSVTLIANSALGIFSHITLSVLNLTRGFHSFAEGFEQGARAFKRMNNPIVLVLRAVAACVLALAVSMWFLTTSFTNLVKAIQGADFKTVITTIGIMIFIAGLLVVLGKVFSKIQIAKQNVVTIIALSSFMKGLANAFVSITEVLKESDLLHIASSLIILASMAGLVILVGKQFEKIKVESSSVKTILALSIMIKVLSSTFKTIAKSIGDLDLVGTLTALGVFIALGGMVMLLGKVFSEITFETSSLRTILGLTAMMLGLTVMFRMINDAVKSTNFFQLLTSLGVFMAISAMLIEIANVFSNTEIKSGSIFGMIGISLMLSTLAKSFVKISDVVYGSDFLSVIASLGILIVFAKLLESVSKAFGNVKIDIITVLGILTFSDFIADIGEFFINALNSIKTATVWDVILALASLGALAGILVWIGEVFSDISVDDEEWVTLLIVTRFMRVAGEMLVAITESFKTASMGTIITSLGTMILIAKILVQVATKFAELEIKSQSIMAVIALSVFMKTLASVFKTILTVINTNTLGYIIGALGILVGMAGLLMLVSWAFSKIEIKSQSMWTIVALSIFMKTLGSVFKTIIDVISGNNLNTIIGALGILVGMAGLLMLVGWAFSEIKIKYQSMFTIIALSIFMKTLSSVFAAVTEIISTNNLETIKQALTILVGMAALLVLVGVAFSLIKVKSQAMFSIIALSIFLKTLSGVFKSIIDIVRENSLETVTWSLGILVGIAGLLVLVCLAFSKIQVKPSSLVTIVMAIIGVVSIVAALSLLALVAQATSMEAVISAAESLTLALIAVAGALFIMSQFSGGVVSAAAIAIVAGSMVILAVAMGMFNDVKWDAVMNGVTVLGALALCLAILGAIGAQTVVGAAALLVASLAITGLAFALKQFEGLDFGNMAQNFILILGVLTIFLVILGGLGAMALMGSAALVITAAALIILGKAMQFIADSGIGGGVLSGIAGGLMLMAIAGILLSAGATGLIIGGIGLSIIGLALKLFANVPEGFGSILSGIAGGLMLFGVAGIVLAIGAAGLVAGGIGLIIIGAGLKIIQGVTIDAKRISDLADSITDLAIAGIISDFGGDGLITLGQGLMYIAQALAILNTLSLQILSISLPGLAEDSAKIGMYIVKGAEQGILKEYPTLLKMVAQLGTGITQVMCNVLDIHSPSGIFKKIGLWILQGLGIGVTDATMTSGLEDTMKGLATDMLSSFTDTLGDGFGKIGDMFEDFNKKTKKWVKTGGHYETGRGWVEEGYWKEVGMFEDMLNFDDMSNSFSSLFDSSGFDGANDLSKIFEKLNNDEIDLDFSTGNLTDSLASLSSGLGETSGATKGLTKEMTGSLDVFAEFDRKVNKTATEIKKNLLTNMVSDNEYREMINDLMVAGFDQDFIKTQITDKGKKEGYEIASAILAEYNSGNGEAVKDWYNKQWRASKGNNVGLDATIALLGLDEKQYDKALKGLDWSDANYAIHGNLAGLADGFDTANLHVKNSSKETGKAVQETYEELGKLNDGVKTTKENADRYQQAISKDDENAATVAVENLSEVIMRAINTYMPAESFVRLGKNICLGLATGIWSYTYLAERAIGMSASDLINLFANKIDSNSPSEVFKEFGEYMMEGLAIGIKDTNDPEQATNKMADDLISHYRMIMNQIIAIMNSDEEWQPTIRPVVDFSNLQTSTGALQTMFDGTQVSLAGKDFSNFKASLAPSGNGLISMSKDEMRQLLAGFADEIVRGVNNGEKNVDVQVNLEGDAKGIFKLVRDENNQYKRTAGYSAFV